MSAIVKLKGAGKQFQGNWALREIDLELPRGEVSAIVGESGSGKSTLLQLINGVYQADAGEVRVFDAPIPRSDTYRFRRRIGYAVQGAGLFPHLNVFDNVTLVARLDGWSADELNARFKQLLQMVGLSADLRDRHPHELSGGQQQRVGLCRAFMMRPDLLLLDEPFSAVDPLTRADIHQEFTSMQRLEATSAVMVTHDMGEAVKLASYLVIVHAGRIVRKGQTAAVTQNPGDPRVARLFEGLA